MPERQFDIAVIGGGPGGYVAAIRASQLGFKVAVIERDRLGGICLNWGCIPTKALLKNAEIYQHFKHADEWGISCKDLKFDFSKIVERSRKVATLNSKGIEYLFKKNKIEHILGFGKVLGNGKIEVSKDGKGIETVSAKHVIIATGGRPRTLPNVKIDGKQVISYMEAMVLPELPKSMVIIGAGAIGVEFAYFYNAFGSEVTLIEMMANILPGEDKEISKLLESSFKKKDIEIFTEAKVESVATSKEVTVAVTMKEGKKQLKADVALMAIGIQGNIENMGLEAVGVKVEKGWIQVDDYGRTNVPGIYAIGDVAGPPWLAHVASREGIVCVEAIAGKNPQPIDYENIPGCTYCQPQVASLGMTEERAIAEGRQIKVGRFPFSASGKARAIGETEGLVKLMFDAKYGELLGAHILGSEATEMIAELGVAKSLETTGSGIYGTIHAHPTLSEAIMEAAENAYGHAIHI
ncbi:MAG: dihydrolipoyl dehydrogenase [Ignavibacteriae bacterium]|nr:dihydrolipoyl dehydrogenase [Ignavibacteriota bacterium]